MKTFLTIVSIILVYALLEYGLNLPKDVGHDVPQGKLNSLSFAPYRDGQGPLDEIFPTPEEVEADMQLMSQKTHSIRTYASAEGTMPLIPGLARKYGLNLLQGAWLGGEADDNQKEISELIRSANQNPDVVKRVIVGNEVLLRGDLEPEALINYIREVKRAIKQPVSYADVWSMYMKHPQLIKEVDFITIHILPYWEDEPIAVELAPAHIERIYKQVQKEAFALVPNIPILIGESGWPSAGRQRGHAIPGVVNEAQFIRNLIEVANKNGFDYNIVEAFNQSWKTALEGVVGGNWGLYTIDRKEVFPLTGHVYENPNWLNKALFAIGFFILLAGASWSRIKQLPFKHQLSWLLILQILIVLLVKQSSFLWYTSYSDWQRLGTFMIVAINLTLSGLIVWRSYCLLAGQIFTHELGNRLYQLYFGLGILAIYRTLTLAIDGRYISFPIQSALIPTFGILALWFISYQLKGLSLPFHKSFDIKTLTGSEQKYRHRDNQLAMLLAASSLLLIIGETKAFVVARDLIEAYPGFSERLFTSLNFTLTNCQLITWLACLIICLLPFWISGRQTNQA